MIVKIKSKKGIPNNVVEALRNELSKIAKTDHYVTEMSCTAESHQNSRNYSSKVIISSQNLDLITYASGRSMSELVVNVRTSVLVRLQNYYSSIIMQMRRKAA